jgi:hypothetical protein
MGRMNFELMGIPFSFLPMVWWCRRSGKIGWEWVFVSIVIGYVVLYVICWESYLWYYVDSIPLIGILAAAGIVRPKRENSTTSEGRGIRMRHCLMVAGLIPAAFGIWPSELGHWREQASPKTQVYAAVANARVGHALVLLDNLPVEMECMTGANSPELNDDVIFARMLRGQEWQNTLRRFPDREPYVLRYDSHGKLQCFRLSQETVPILNSDKAELRDVPYE